MNDAPIGIFDSGVGGLTVARAIQDQLPNEQILYIGVALWVAQSSIEPATIKEYVHS